MCCSRYQLCSQGYYLWSQMLGSRARGLQISVLTLTRIQIFLSPTLLSIGVHNKDPPLEDYTEKGTQFFFFFLILKSGRNREPPVISPLSLPPQKHVVCNINL